MFLPVLDRLFHELERRFSATHCDVLRGIQSLSLSSEIFRIFSSLSSFAEANGADLDDLSHELHQAKRVLQRMVFEDRQTTLVAFISHIERYGVAFAELRI